MEHDLSLRFAQFIVLFSLTCWMMLAVLNNIMDSSTNITLLNRMMSMSSLKEDIELGSGLEKRAINSRAYAKMALGCVILVQLIIVVLMVFGVFMFARGVFAETALAYTVGVQAATIGITAFMGLWFFFLTGGLFFGYWIKMPNVQQVHFVLIVISIMTLILVRI